MKCRICNTRFTPKYSSLEKTCSKDCEMQYRKDNPVKKKTYKTKTYKRKPTGEKAMFLDLWDNLMHNCSNCYVHLGEEPKAQFFSHIITKGKRPDLRLKPANIMLECLECHQIWDFGTMEERLNMENFDYKMEYIRKNDATLYQLMLNKIEDLQ